MGQELKIIVRILNTDIPGKKKVMQGLTKIYGVSKQFSNAVCEVTNTNKIELIGKLEDQKIKELEETIKNPRSKNIPSWLYNRKRDYDTGEDIHLIGPTLKLRKEFDIRHMKKIKSYRGMRHAWGLPVRGQRTKGHFRKKGSAVGVIKRKPQPAKKTTKGGKKK